MPQADCCQSCGAPIRWATTITGGRMPVDVEPSGDGNVLLAEGKLAIVLGGLTDEARESARKCGVQLYVSHFVTCPDRADWRGARRD